MRAYSFETDKNFVRKVLIRDGMVMFHRNFDNESPSMNHDITGGLLTLRILILRRAQVMSMFIEGLPLFQHLVLRVVIIEVTSASLILL